MKNKLRSSLFLKIISVLLSMVVLFLIGYAAAGVIKSVSRYSKGTQIKKPEQDAEITTAEEKELKYRIPQNTYAEEGFYDIADVRYYADDQYVGVPGIDVSGYQSSVDWEAVREAGIEFVMVQVGYRGWGSGDLVEDVRFREHISGALDAGLDVGVYFFSQALTEEEAVEEAQYTLSLISGYDVTLPVVYDWEEVESESARTNEMNMLMLTACAEAFCATIRDAGYEAGVYFNQAYGYEQLNLESLKDNMFWLAQYSDTPSFVYQFQMWQYTDKGKIPGIEGDVDLNIMFNRK